VRHWPRVDGLAASAGVRLRVTKSEISANLWGKWLGEALDSTTSYISNKTNHGHDHARKISGGYVDAGGLGKQPV